MERPTAAQLQEKLPTLIEMLRFRAHEQPGKRTFTFFENGVDESGVLTLGELDARARAIAVQLGKLAPIGSRALLSYPAGLDFISAFFGCLYAGMVAVPVAPITSDRADVRRTRLEAIAASAQPELFLSNAASLAQISGALSEVDALAALTTVATDEIGTTDADTWTRPQVGPQTIAYLQYSSGSTGLPKGVVLTHGNVMHNLALILESGARPDEEEDHVTPPLVSWLPMFHDMGLISSVVEPVFVGYDTVLMPPMAFVQRPLSWLRQISRLGDAISAAPNFAFELCLRRITDKQLATLDLSGWHIAMVGAEPVRADTIEQFSARFAAAGFRREAFFPSYGLAESTVMVSGGPFEAEPLVARFDSAALTKGRVQVTAEQAGGRELVGCGQMQPTLSVKIVEPGTGRVCDGDEVGEILVSGPSVGAGYFNAPEVTAQTFDSRVDGEGDQPYLRTGDLGFIHADQLFVTGRVKDVIIIDGNNHYPQDVETTVTQAHPAVRAGFCAAFSTDDGQRERLIVMAELNARFRLAGAGEEGGESARQQVTAEEVTAAIRSAVTGAHGVAPGDIVLLKVGSLPFTSSGKLQRAECRSRYQAGTWTGATIASALPAGR